MTINNLKTFITNEIKISTLVHGNKNKLKRPSLALLRCKLTFEIFELGLISVQNDFWNFRAWPYCGAKWLLKFSSLALLRCKLIFEIIELGLIAAQNDFWNFRAWPYCGANRLGLIAVHQCINIYKNVEILLFQRTWVACWVFPWRCRYFFGFHRSWWDFRGRSGTLARPRGLNPREIVLLGHATFYSNTISKHLQVFKKSFKTPKIRKSYLEHKFNFNHYDT